MKINGKDDLTFNYDNLSRDSAINQINYFGSDFGGTNILLPLTLAFTARKPNFKTRIFLLTDG
jgi:hypothetical protein